MLEGARLGYDSALVAGRVPAERVDEVARIVAEHPTVTHDYLRDHDYNLWFTIATAPGTSLERTLAALERLTGVERFWPLRRTHTFKIGVRFDLDTLENATAAPATGAGGASEIEPARDDAARAMLRALQRPLPFTRRPFAELAASAGVDEDRLLAFAEGERGRAIRRYVATFRHRKLGVRGNGMVVWSVPEARLEEVGARLAAAPEVSHCYARTPIEGFPYALYSMVHAKDAASVDAIVSRLAEEVGVHDRRVLHSTREYKKVRLRYFLDEERAWWARHCSGGPS